MEQQSFRLESKRKIHKIGGSYFVRLDQKFIKANNLDKPNKKVLVIATEDITKIMPSDE